MHLLVASLHSRVSESLRTLNDPSLSRRLSAEELANALTHGVGLIMSIVGFAILLSLAVIRGGALRIAGCAIYGGTLLSLYAASTCYHGSRSRRLKRILKICDHSAIYLLVGSHLYQVHLYPWLESNDYRRLLPDSKAYIYKVKRTVCLSYRSKVEAIRNFCAAHPSGQNLFLILSSGSSMLRETHSFGLPTKSILPSKLASKLASRFAVLNCEGVAHVLSKNPGKRIRSIRNSPL